MPIRIPALAGLLLLAACGGEPAEPAPDADPVAEPEEPLTMTTRPDPPPMGTEADAEAAARADLAERLDVAPERIELVEQRRVTWRDGSMGCPEPGMMYTQALVPGYWIRLSVDGTTYDYHGARGRTPFHCPGDRAQSPLPPDDEPLT